MTTLFAGNGKWAALHSGTIGEISLIPRYGLRAINDFSRCTAHRPIPGSYKTTRRGVRTTVYGEKRMFIISFLL